MKYLSLILFLVFNTSYSQIFVDDVERVETVVIEYKVDEKGKRYDVAINKEFTTYLDKDWQLGCLDHFNNATMRFSMKMANGEWKNAYYFVNSKYKIAKLSEKDKTRCNVFRKGTYTYESLLFNNTKIIRRKRKQIEKSPEKDQRQMYKIDWLDDHIYTLTALKLPLEKDQHKIGRVIRVEIIEILDDNTYLYKSSSEDTPKVIFGIIKKITD